MQIGYCGMAVAIATVFVLTIKFSIEKFYYEVGSIGLDSLTEELLLLVIIEYFLFKKFRINVRSHLEIGKVVKQNIEIRTIFQSVLYVNSLRDCLMRLRLPNSCLA
jgi:hypothetical protein